MTEEIDYKGMAQGLMVELEDARRAIADLHFSKNRVTRLRTVNGDSIRLFVQKNYLVILVAIMLFSFALSSLKMIRGLLTSKE